MKQATINELKRLVPIIETLLEDPEVIDAMAEIKLEPDWDAFEDFKQAVADLSSEPQYHDEGNATNHTVDQCSKDRCGFDPILPQTEGINPPGPRYL